MATRHDSGPRGERAPESFDREQNEDEIQEVAVQRATAPPKNGRDDAIRRLKSLVKQLEHMSSVSVTVELALKGQAADQDIDIGQCVRLHVTGALYKRIDDVVAIGRHLGATIESPFEYDEEEVEGLADNADEDA
jgi:hypothetical protein